MINCRDVIELKEPFEPFFLSKTLGKAQISRLCYSTACEHRFLEFMSQLDDLF